MKIKALSILIVDDNTAARKLLRSVLGGMINQQFVIYEADSGSEVINNFSLNYYDIVFLDIEMPGTNGFEVLAAIMSEYPDQFVVIVSANATVSNVKKTIDLHGQGFIAKPYTTKKIKGVVDKYLQKDADQP